MGSDVYSQLMRCGSFNFYGPGFSMHCLGSFFPQEDPPSSWHASWCVSLCIWALLSTESTRWVLNGGIGL